MARRRPGYRLELDLADMRALQYIAQRYESGKVLYDHLDLVDDEASFLAGHRVIWQLSEPAAWEYRDALESEGGVVPPLAGGHLQQELLKFYDRIV